MMNILYIDDCICNLKLMMKIINNIDVNISLSTASQSYIAFDFINKNKYELIITDLFFPAPDACNGIQIIEFIKKSALNNCTPFFVVSGTEDKNNIKQCMELGAIEFMIKPINIINLKKIINLCKKN